ncbi:MAG: DUF4249 domain-containing protein [Tannerellaceae bacterium]|jgi:hypothetical protein|nr:DUF4249 domain-containing protein [Tannerellaceae bacterium]
MMKIRTYICLLIASISPSCIDRFDPYPAQTFPGGILVVEGSISGALTTITLSHSTAAAGAGTAGFIGASDTDIATATLHIECSDGSTSAPADYLGEGAYAIETGDLDGDKQYRLHIALDGEEYESDFLAPILTPQIDSLSWLKEGRGKPVHITVSTHADDNQPPYYRWTYKEDWEFKAELFSAARFVSTIAGVDYYAMYDLHTSNNVYYCWGSDISKGFILGSSDRLESNTISQKKLIAIEPADEKLSMLYRVIVGQQQIRAQAYEYFSNLQKNVSQSGGLFAHIPAEIEGNIHCLTNPALPVVGYIEVATITSAERLIPEPTGLYEPPIALCALQVVHRMNKGSLSSIYDFIQEQGQGPEPYMVVGLPLSYAPGSCLNCTSRGTKNKPAGWPTDHL